MKVMHSSLRVKTAFEVEHFVKYVGLYSTTNLTLLGRSDKYHIVDIKGELFEIHEDIFPLMLTKCNGVTITNRVLQ